MGAPAASDLRIRVVGSDLHPCGLVRDLLRVVDGVFNFMIGLLMTALGDNWQRLGDMTSRIIDIVREDHPPIGAQPAGPLEPAGEFPAGGLPT